MIGLVARALLTGVVVAAPASTFRDGSERLHRGEFTELLQGHCGARLAGIRQPHCLHFSVHESGAILGYPADDGRRRNRGPEPIVVPLGREPRIDGIMDPDEWADASRVAIEVDDGWTVEVYYKHDEANLYAAFMNLKRGEEERYPEVLIGTGPERASTWRPTDHWFHASYQDCDSSGRPNDYSTCAPARPGWSANNFPLTPLGMVAREIVSPV